MTSRTGNERGFSLIELLIAASVLALSVTMIQGSFLGAARVFGRYQGNFEAEAWMNEKLWDAEEALLFSDPPDTSSEDGVFSRSGRQYEWHKQIDPLPQRDLYSVRLTASWSEGQQRVERTREVHVFRKEKTPLV